MPLTNPRQTLRIKKTLFTASGTFTPDPTMLYCIIECVGGGGGGGAAAGAVGQVYNGGGGGSGGYSRFPATPSDVGTSQVVTRGAGGAGGLSTPANGSAGGDTSVGALCIGKGGAGGLYGSIGQFATGGAGGVAGTGDLTAIGSPGGAGFYNSVNATCVAPSANGGSSYFGGGGLGVLSYGAAVTGGAASNYGGGGAGGSVSNIAANAAGGPGSAGAVWITEFCTP